MGRRSKGRVVVTVGAAVAACRCTNLHVYVFVSLGRVCVVRYVYVCVVFPCVFLFVRHRGVYVRRFLHVSSFKFF